MKIARTEQLSRLVRSVAVNPAQLARATVRLEAPAPARRRQVILAKRVKPPHLSTMPISRPMFYRRGHVAVGPVERIVGHRFPAGSAGSEVRSSRELLVVHDSLRLAEALRGRTPPLIQLAENPDRGHVGVEVDVALGQQFRARRPASIPRWGSGALTGVWRKLSGSSNFLAVAERFI